MWAAPTDHTKKAPCGQDASRQILTLMLCGIGGLCHAGLLRLCLLHRLGTSTVGSRGSMRRRRGLHLRALLGVEVPDNLVDVVARLAVRRNAVVLLYAVGSSIVGGQRFDGIVVIAVQQRAQVRSARFHVGLGIERISHSELSR